MVRRVVTAGSVFDRIWGAGSLKYIEQHPAISSHLIDVLCALLLLGSRKRSSSRRCPYRSTHSTGTWTRIQSGATRRVDIQHIDHRLSYTQCAAERTDS